MSDSRKSWTPEVLYLSFEEDSTLKALIKKHGTHQWTEISKKMCEMYGEECRSGKQCRERWFNNLNPKINKDEWTPKEDEELFKYHEKYGNKWKVIADKFSGRTDCFIKNKFYSTIRKKLRKINKLLGMKNSTMAVREIKPKVLSKIIDSASKNEEIKATWTEFTKLFLYEEGKLKKLFEGEQKENISNLFKKIQSIKEKRYNFSEIYLLEKEEDKDKIEKEENEKENESKKKKEVKFHKAGSTSLKSIQDFKETQEDNIHQLDPFDFDINFEHPHLTHLQSFTPYVKKRSSLEDLTNNNVSNNFNLETESPRGFSKSFRSPREPTPRANLGSSIDFVSNYDLTNQQYYNEVIWNMQNQVMKEMGMRK